MRHFAIILSISLLTGLSVSSAQAQEGVQAGVSAAVRGVVQLARGETVVGRQIDSGDPIYLQDEIRSGADSGMQILLLDETVFTIGPNSEMTIDEFVYDPATGAGQVAATVAKGVFRFVTGQVAQNDPDNMAIKTPLGTIGIRGTIGGGTVSLARTEIVLLGPGVNNNTPERSGAIVVTNGQGAVTIERTGYGTVLLPESPPTPPAPSGSAFLQGLRSGTPVDTGRQNGGTDDTTNETNDPQGGQNGASGVLSNASSATGQSGSVAFQNSVSTDNIGRGPRQGDVGANEVGSAIGSINSIAQLNGSTGLFHFSDTGNLSDGGSYSIAVDIDFSARTIGGGNSEVSVSPAGFGSGSFSILSNDFSSGRDGQAVFDSQNNINFNCGANTCNGAVVMKFRSLNGEVAGAMEHEVTVTDTTLNQTVTGSGTDTTRSNGSVGGNNN
ncbi:FecR family protein [Pacificispira sp.]|uniref:FecR family protein n=1 Tax=Pacificispira sp. TaxID=2888761 RepID=UPI003BAAE1D2